MIEDDSTIEIEGHSEEEAAQRASEALNTRRENLGYEIVDASKRRGLMGIVGGKKKVKIRAWRKDARGEDALGSLAKLGKEVIENILKHICKDFTLEAIEHSDTITLQIEGDEGGLIIGKNGNTLDAIQFVVRKVIGRHFPDNDKQIIVNAEGYRERRRDSLIAMAKRTAKKVRSSKRKESLRPMNAYERRLVHLALEDESGVSTRSQGEGFERCIVIYPEGRKAGSRKKRQDNAPYDNQ